ncbi:MAG: hypothetical protein LUG57_00890 [Oscillospiraceae bacterium]|nr:hypothetical protein [Oscillospiraceae bacterium]
MDTDLKKDIYEELALVWQGAAGREFSAECVVPDTMPDVGSPVDAEGILTLRSKDTEAGSVRLAASLSVWVLYMPEGGGTVQSLPVTVPVELSMEAEPVDTDCRTVARLRVRALDARAANSRKISLRADITARARSYQKRRLELAVGLEGEAASAHVLTRTVSVTAVSDVREKTFVAADEYQLPAGGASAILSQRAEAAVEEVKVVSGKAVFRGRVWVDLVLAGGEEGQVFSGRYETEFSQIMEIDGESEAVPEITLMLTGAYFDLPERGAENGRTASELHLAAQCVCRQTREICYMADVYSNRTLLTAQTEPLTLVTGVKHLSMRQTVTGSAEPSGAAGEVLALSARVSGVSVEEGTVKTSVSVRLLCRQPDGQLSLSRCRLGAEFTPDLPGDTALSSVTVRAADVYYAPSGAGLDVRAGLQMEALAVSKQEISSISQVTEDGEAWAAMPPAASVTLARVEPEADLWALAKRYHSTPEAIEKANEGREKGLLLIPKCR